MTKTLVVIGAGAGFGGHVGKRFARDDDHRVQTRRSHEAGLYRIEAFGGAAMGVLLDATKADAFGELVERVERVIGPFACAP